MTTIKRLFMLDPGVIFLNHGSFGACPRPVFKAYQAWQRRLENQPIQFFHHDLPGFERETHRALGAYLNVNPEDLALVTNATYGVNIISRSLALEPGDEILTTDQEYGSCVNAWKYACRKTGASYIQRPVRLPARSMEEVANDFWQGVTPRTKVIYLSHITSSALWLPIEEICRRARQNSILTLIDGAHAPGQIPLDLAAIGADFYAGNCHKWMLCPKGAGFLYSRPEVQNLVQPLVVSRAFEPEKASPESHPMVDYFTWTGTRDPAALLSIPAAIAFMEKYHWDEVRQQCHALLRWAMSQICDMTGLEPLYPLDSGFYAQMGAVPLPIIKDLSAFQHRLYHDFKVVIPAGNWNGRYMARISVQGYNTKADIELFLKVLSQLLKEFAE